MFFDFFWFFFHGPMLVITNIIWFLGGLIFFIALAAKFKFFSKGDRFIGMWLFSWIGLFVFSLFFYARGPEIWPILNLKIKNNSPERIIRACIQIRNMKDNRKVNDEIINKAIPLLESKLDDKRSARLIYNFETNRFSTPDDGEVRRAKTLVQKRIAQNKGSNYFVNKEALRTISMLKK